MTKINIQKTAIYRMSHYMPTQICQEDLSCQIFSYCCIIVFMADVFLLRYEALVRGKMEHAVEYREQIYIFETKQKQDKFLR